jgi:CRISPR-associated protein Csx17
MPPRTRRPKEAPNQPTIDFNAPAPTPSASAAPAPSSPSPTVPSLSPASGALHTISFSGCAPEPLSHYLKGLAIFRLIAEQLDPSARATWEGDVLSVTTTFSRAEIERFFLHDYQPTHIVSPWNGGSGFYSKDNHDGINAILSAPAGSRFAPYAETIRTAQGIIQGFQLTERPTKEAKVMLLTACRAQLPDEALAWIDAAFILTVSDHSDTEAAFPPLLGTGGNDGRLDFSNNFMQRVALTLLDTTTGAPRPQAASWLKAALFGDTSEGMTQDAIGQFFPSASGGPNTVSGFDGRAVVNPWDFVLTLEGAVLFAASAVRRMGVQGMPSICAPPFTVRAISAGYGSASPSEKSRAEIWLPLWNRPASLRELRALLSEGRARLQQRPVQSALDFSRAVASLGVDRGIHAFSRVGLLERNGLAYFGVPLGRFRVPSPADTTTQYLAPLDEIQDWIATVQRAANDDLAPKSLQAAVNQLQDAVIDLCQRRDATSLTLVFLSLGRCERALARSVKWVVGLKFSVSPLTLKNHLWLSAAEEAAYKSASPSAPVIFRLAASLASVSIQPRPYPEKNSTDDAQAPTGDTQTPAIESALPLMREHLEPIQRPPGGRWWTFTDTPSPDVVWHDGALERALSAVMQRRLIAAQRSKHTACPDHGCAWCALSDIEAFIHDHIDARALRDMLWACALVSPIAHLNAFQRRQERTHSTDTDTSLSLLYAALRLCFTHRPPHKGCDAVPTVPLIFQLAASGQAAEASKRALRRLRASGAPSVLGSQASIPQSASTAQRTAAALLIPIGKAQHTRLCKQLLAKPVDERNTIDKEIL